MQNQPFLFLNENEEKCLLYCNSEQKRELFFGNVFYIDPWKIYKNYNGLLSELNTPTELEGYGKVILECNPHLFYKENQLYIGYTAGVSKGKNTPIIYYYLNSKINSDFSVIYDTQVIKKTFSASYINEILYYVKKTLEKDLFIKNETVLNLHFNIKYIYRICPIFSKNNYFIITFNDEIKDQSWILNAEGTPIVEIKNLNNESVYKCSILNDDLIYTKKVNSNDRVLIEEKLNPEIYLQINN